MERLSGIQGEHVVSPPTFPGRSVGNGRQYESSKRAISPLRVFLSGRASDALDALRRRLTADQNLEIVDRAELAEAVIMLPHEAGTSLPRRRAEREELIESLTTREHDVLAFVADGLSNREVAHELAISEHTVKFHLASIFGKLGVSTRTEAVQRGVRLGVIEI